MSSAYRMTGSTERVRREQPALCFSRARRGFVLMAWGSAGWPRYPPGID